MPKLYKVGGCIRDKFLGINSKDIDFTFVLDDLNQTVEEGFTFMEDWMTERGFEIFLSTPEMFTIRAKFPKDDPNTGLVADFVMARKEVGYEDDSRRPKLVLGNLENDLVRRDFTVNALAEDEAEEITREETETLRSIDKKRWRSRTGLSKEDVETYNSLQRKRKIETKENISGYLDSILWDLIHVDNDGKLYLL